MANGNSINALKEAMAQALYLPEIFWNKLEEALKRTAGKPEVTVKLAELEWYDVRSFSLGTARTGEEIEGLYGPGDVVFAISLDGTVYIHFDESLAEQRQLHEEIPIRNKFSKLYLTNTAQAGKTLKLLIAKGPFDTGKVRIVGTISVGTVGIDDAAGTRINPAKEDGNLASIVTQLNITLSALRDALKGASAKDFSTLETELDKKPDEATTPNAYNVALTLANTEYSQALPTGTKTLEFWAREDVIIRFAFTTGKVATPTAPYFTLKAGSSYYKENLNLTGKTLYLGSATAATNVEIIAWT